MNAGLKLLSLVATVVVITACGGAPADSRQESRSAPAALTGPGNATYDSTRHVPACLTPGAYCDTGTLVNGRALLGPEPNPPNTLNNSCADRTAGTYHYDESIDRVRVATNDGSNLAPGKTVTVTVDFWAASYQYYYPKGGEYGWSMDTIDVYYAPNAASPVWTRMSGPWGWAPYGPNAGSATFTFTLSQGGSVQALRATINNSLTVSPCAGGNHDDADDVAFAVN